MVEQRIRNAQVVGSSPIPSSIAQTPTNGGISLFVGVFYNLFFNKIIENNIKITSYIRIYTGQDTGQSLTILQLLTLIQIRLYAGSDKIFSLLVCHFIICVADDIY